MRTSSESATDSSFILIATRSQYLFDYHFTIVTDHKALTFIDEVHTSLAKSSEAVEHCVQCIFLRRKVESVPHANYLSRLRRNVNMPRIE